MTLDPSIPEQRAMVVAEALDWVGTPYHHAARIKRVGVDCAHLLLVVFVAVGLVEDFTPEPYPHDWHLHRSEERFLAVVEQFATEITRDRLELGDVLLFRWGRTFAHGAIYIGDDRVVHANIRDGEVTIGELSRDGELFERPTRYFSIWSS